MPFPRNKAREPTNDNIIPIIKQMANPLILLDQFNVTAESKFYK